MNNNELREELKKYWTPKRYGKHEELPNQHGMLLLKNLKVDPKDLFEQIYENRFDFQSFSKIMWTDFLKRAKLAEYLRPEYLKDALNVTSSRPAIGKGEFLLVSCFSNLGFAPTKGDIVDFNTGKLCEIKGARATLSGDNKAFCQMNKSIMFSVYSLFNTGAHFDHFNRECAKELDELLKTNPKLVVKVLELLQNIRPVSASLAEDFAELYNIKPDLFVTVGAMQLYTYMSMQNADFLIMVDNEGFCCFERPKTAIESQRIISSINLSSWQTGDYGMTVSI